MDAKGPKRGKKSTDAEPKIREEAAKPARGRPGKGRQDIPGIPELGPDGEFTAADEELLIRRALERLRPPTGPRRRRP